MCYPLRLLESVTRVIRLFWQWTGVDYGAVLCWFGVGDIRHGYHGNTEVDTETIDHSEPKEHQGGQAEASRAAQRRDCSHRIQFGLFQINFLINKK